MNVKRTLIESLPPGIKRMLAVPYDLYQTRSADRQFAAKDLPSYNRGEDAPDHIVFVVVDALRADAIDEETTPYLASLNGCSAVTPGAWTFPAMSSVLSGVYPHEHGAMKQTDEPDDSEGLTLPPRMDEDRETIPEMLAGAGYDTYGGFGHDTPFVALSGRFQTHELYHSINSDAEDVLEEYLDWARDRDRTFALLHLADPHIPVDPPREYWENHDVDRSIDGLESWRYNQTVDCDQQCQRYREHRRRLYRAAVDFVDDALAEFADGLEATLGAHQLLITADHGEMLWDHVAEDVERFGGGGCVGHGGAPYEELARVPLLTNQEWEFEETVSLIDIAPTIADMVGIDGPAFPGRSILAAESVDRMVLIEGSLSGYEKKAIYDGNKKLLVSKGDGVEIAYKLTGDEPTDLAAEETELPEETVQSMRENLPPWPDGEGLETEVSGVVEDRLEKLGYR